jgi:hypothetical protein
MTTSILAENKTVKNAESHVVDYDSNSLSSFMTELDRLIKDLEEPVYDIPRPIESHYDVPRKLFANRKAAEPIYDIPRPIESHYDTPKEEKSLAKRALPPLPVEPFKQDDSIYAEISEVKVPQDSSKIKMSPHQAKIYVSERLRRCLLALKKFFSAIQFNQSNDVAKALQDAINADPVVSEKLMLDLAEFKFSTLGSLESLQELTQILENIIFVLEGRVAASMKVYNSVDYGDMLGVKLTQPMAQAKFELSQAKERLAEVLAMESTSTNVSEKTEAQVSAANNRFTLFGKTASTAAKVEDNVLYDKLDVVNGLGSSV